MSMIESQPASRPRHVPPAERRSDARRNYEQILAGATKVLKVDASASLQDIAASVGLHRATLHRHFRSREDLVAVLRQRSAERTLRALDAAEASSEPTAVRIPAFVRQVIENALPAGVWRFATYHGSGMDDYVQELNERSAALMEDGRRDGVLRSDLDAASLSAVWGGVSYAILPLVDGGVLTVGEAVALVMAALTVPA